MTHRLTCFCFVCSIAAFSSHSIAQEWTWQKLQSNGPDPSGRYGHKLAYDAARDKVVLFGGWDGSAYVNDTWEWDPQTELWSELQVAGPSVRYYHALAYDEARGVSVMFGGGVWPNADAQTWEWNGSTWTQQLPSISPPATSTHGMAYDLVRQQVILACGRASGGFPYDPVASVWTYDGSTATWAQLAAGPSERAHPGLAWWGANGSLVLHGGSYDLDPRFDPPGVYFGDTWALNGSPLSWSLIGPTASPASGMAIAPHMDRGSVIRFGGADESDYFNTTWELRSEGWVDLEVSGPPSIWSSEAVWVESRRSVLMFGGREIDGTFVDDIWELTYNCEADWNDDGTLNTQDLIVYLNDYSSVLGGGTFVFRDPDLAAPTGVLNTADFVAYLNLYGSGCL